MLQLLCCVRYTYNRTEVEVLNSAKLCYISSVISIRVGLMIGLMAVVLQEKEVLNLSTERLWLAIRFKIIRGFFCRVYTCLNTIRMGFEPKYTAIKIAYIRVFKWPHICVNLSAGICEINTQIYASYKGPYMRVYVLKCARICGSRKSRCICRHE